VRLPAIAALTSGCWTHQVIAQRAIGTPAGTPEACKAGDLFEVGVDLPCGHARCASRPGRRSGGPASRAQPPPTSHSARARRARPCGAAS
jgi:hypothetical protein